MNEESSGKVFYICFYFEPETEDAVVTYPSVISKIDYIVNTIKRTNREVKLVSIAPARKGLFEGFSKRIDCLESHVYLRSRSSENRILKKLEFILHNWTILTYLMKHVKKNDFVLVYHSLYNRLWLRVFRLFVPGRLILQIEDVFSEMSPSIKRFKRNEWALLRKMQKCICVNDLIYRKLPEVPEKIVSYGSYAVLPKYEVVTHDKVRLVYAGVIEQERNAAFLAVKAMRYLDANYELHILGFGDPVNIAALEKLVEDVNDALGRKAAVYHGRLQGEAYWRFLQSCDIALSTHAYTEGTLSSATYTFPSKVLTYLSNDLPVVAQRLEVLESSSIADCFCFYENPNPEEIAEAIRRGELRGSYDGRKTISELDKHFEKDLRKLFDHGYAES